MQRDLAWALGRPRCPPSDAGPAIHQHLHCLSQHNAWVAIHHCVNGSHRPWGKLAFGLDRRRGKKQFFGLDDRTRGRDGKERVREQRTVLGLTRSLHLAERDKRGAREECGEREGESFHFMKRAHGELNASQELSRLRELLCSDQPSRILDSLVRHTRCQHRTPPFRSAPDRAKRGRAKHRHSRHSTKHRHSM
eukprot:3265164-Rhodomonas_salina.3